jgi:hypothetical protein
MKVVEHAFDATPDGQGSRPKGKPYANDLSGCAAGPSGVFAALG